MSDANVSELAGKTLVAVTDGEKGSNQIIFECSDGSEYLMDHTQDCCERVAVKDVTGNWADLIGVQLKLAEESTNDTDLDPSEHAESWTWTFYRFGTEKGYVNVRWLGESNGYYSERVDFSRTRAPSAPQPTEAGA